MALLINSENKINIRQTLADIWQYKDLLLILAWRDYKVRYAQTMLGFVWAILQPLTTLMIFILVFSRVAKIDTGSIPYPVFAQSGMIAWTYFAFLISQAGNSIIGAQGMVKKIYFPRLIIPLSKALVGLIDFGISFLLFIGIALYYQFVPSSNIIYLPLYLILVILGGLGLGIWISALTVRFRDFTHVVPFIIQIGMYISPIAYPVSKVPEQYQLLYSLNPMVGVIEGIRWCILGGVPPTNVMYFSISILLLLFVSSIYYFKKVEKIMADII